ncbi:MAG: NAD(P)H-hydrate dehydratase [Bacteroidetes bacterium]|nr:NAD(P)H-hydrate dehydratase [Bacteroidota bacterium]MBU1114550.1 NAD(P)H-hydrate dehydratase [Bacteroidota bacterium]MBU1798613.1 NAD(P)H-hydrate dehydratase [Bacteroidota bacterium]
MIPLFTTIQIRNADKYAIEQLKIPGIVLMENASLSVYNSIKKNYNLINEVSQIGIIAGKGNNGGDAFAVARHFINDGFIVNILFVGTESELKGDALINFTICKELCKEVNNGNVIFYKSKSDLTKIKNSDVIIDGLLGTGTKGEIREPYKSIIEFVNELNAYRVAIDLPSGLNIETATGSSIFNSDLTITLADYKTGLFYGKGYEFSGKVEKGSIGIGKEYFENQIVKEYLIEPEDALQGLPKKKKTSHKYSNGKVLAIVGSGKYIGAASLLVRSLFQVGTGSVLLAFPKSIRNLISTNIGETVFAAYNDEGKEYLTSANISELKQQLDWADLITIGSGLGREPETIKAIAEIIIKYKAKKMVIDADAIYAIAEYGISKFDLRNKILTPHHAEFSHLLGITVTELQSNLINYGKEFAQKTKSILILKGAPTIIFLPNGDSLINSAGNVGMAKFGSGDVLSGIIAGLVSFSSDMEQTVISAVYLHSLSADLLLLKETEFGITATKIKENIPSAISFLRNSII